MLPQDRLDQITRRFEFLEARLNAGPPADEIAAISREYAELTPVVAGIAEWRGAQAALTEAQAMLADPEMRELAEDELARSSLEALKDWYTEHVPVPEAQPQPEEPATESAAAVPEAGNA